MLVEALTDLGSRSPGLEWTLRTLEECSSSILLTATSYAFSFFYFGIILGR